MQAVSRVLTATAAVLLVAVAGKAGLHADVSPGPTGGALENVRQDLPDGPGKDVLVQAL